MTSQSVNLLFRDIQGRFFLQFRDANAAIEPLCWSFWGGRVEPCDSGDLRHAACRETAEELGLIVQPADFKIVHERQGSDGKQSILLACRRTIGWNDVTIAEGAGGGFFPQESLPRLTMHKRLRYYCEEQAWVFERS